MDYLAAYQEVSGTCHARQVVDIESHISIIIIARSADC